MNALKFVIASVLLCFAAAAAAAPQHPELYSFEDVFRLTVSASPVVGPAIDEPQPLRAVTLQAQPAIGETRFSVQQQAPRPAKWLLLLSGFALAGWVAHRRLAQLW